MERQESDLSNAIRIGHVLEVDAGRALCRIALGEMALGWLPWLVGMAGETRTWSTPSVGEQVLLLAPEGDPAAGIVLRGLYSSAMPAPDANPAVRAIHFADGAVLRYDESAHALEATLPDGGTAEITAGGGITIHCEGGVTINGPVTINGDLAVDGDADVTGTATAEVDVIGGGKSLKNHRHTAVTAGTAVSGPPQ